MIVHVITGLQGAGAEHALFRLLSASSLPTRVVSLTDGGVFGPRLERIGIPVNCMRMRQGRLPDPFMVFRLAAELRRWKTTLVQTWMYHGDLVGGLAARVAGVPVVWNIRNGTFAPTETSRLTRAVIKACALTSRWLPAAAVSCSAKAVEVHREAGYRCRFEVIPNGITADEFQPSPDCRKQLRVSLGISADATVFGHAGRAHPHKDHATLLRAFGELAVTHPSARLVLCGNGIARGDAVFEALPRNPVADARLHPIGPRDDMPAVYPGFDALVMSSCSEAFPNVVAEAMACGVPCIVTDVGDAAEIVGDTGWVVPSRNPQALSRAMREVADLPAADRAARGMAARRRIMERYSMAGMAEAYRRLWMAVAGKELDLCAD